MSRSRGVPVAFDRATALVTGAGHGIGAATALALAGRGATVISADLDSDAAEATAASCRAAGWADSWATPVDVGDPSAMAGLAERVHDRHGPLDVLVNNAGIASSGRLLEAPADEWERLRQVNLDGVVLGCRLYGPPMLAAGRGHVVNLASVLAFQPSAPEAAYATTKAAVMALSLCLRADWSRSGVGVSVVCPGLVDTAIAARAQASAAGSAPPPNEHRETTILGWRGHPRAKVAAAIVDAVERNRALVPVGFDARLAWWSGRVLPVEAVQRWARLRTPR